MKKRAMRGFVWAVAALFVLCFVGCRDDKPTTDVSEKGSEGRDENVLALVGDEEITRADVEDLLERLPPRRRDIMKQRALDDRIEMRVFANEATAAGLDQDPEIKESLDRVRKETLARAFVNQRLDKEAEPSEETLKEYYDAHQDQFLVPESVLVQQILVREEDKAEEVLAALKSGASFKDLAEEASIARSRKGLEGKKWLYKGKTDPALEKAAFELEKDALSSIIKAKKGFFIIKVLEKREPRYFTFDEAREKIRVRLFWQNKKKIINNYYDAAGVNTHPTEPGMLVTIGDERITEDTITPILAKAPEKDREKLKLRWIDYFVETSVFSKEAEKVGLDKDLEVMRKLRLGRDRVLAKAFRERFIAGKAEVTDEDIAQYYESHQEAFKVPEKVRAKSILVKTRKEAEELLRELKEEETPFGYLAQKKSLHPRAEERAGEIGWFARGEKDPALEEVAFSLEKGQMSNIIQTKDGFEIIKVMDKKGGGVQPLDKVRGSIRMTLMAEHLDKEKKRYYEKAGVKILGVFE